MYIGSFFFKSFVIGAILLTSMKDHGNIGVVPRGLLRPILHEPTVADVVDPTNHRTHYILQYVFSHKSLLISGCTLDKRSFSDTSRVA